MSTPHNNAKPGDFAKTVLMPGDPLRAKFIAETFLENPQLVNNVKTAQAGLNTPVVIAADRDVRYEQVIDVMKALQGANVERVGLALQIEGGRQ